MDDVIVGLLAIGVGVLLCLWGFMAMRLVIPIWGAFSGLVFGAGLASAMTDDRFLSTALGWVLGLLFAALFGALAYFYFQFCVVLGFAGFGFAMGTGLMAALGLEWSWFVAIIGLVVGVAFGAMALFANLPMLILIAFSAIAGAVIVVLGGMLVFNTVDLEELSSGATTDTVDVAWFWFLTFFVAVVASFGAQLRAIRDTQTDLRQVWEGGTPITPADMGPPTGLPPA
jgi:hypothetical protein